MTTITHEINTDFDAKVEIILKEVDASFDHAFGTKKETEIVIDDWALISFEKWNEAGNEVIRKEATPEEMKEIEEIIYSLEF